MCHSAITESRYLRQQTECAALTSNYLVTQQTLKTSYAEKSHHWQRSFKYLASTIYNISPHAIRFSANYWGFQALSQNFFTQSLHTSPVLLTKDCWCLLFSYLLKVSALLLRHSFTHHHHHHHHQVYQSTAAVAVDVAVYRDHLEWLLQVAMYNFKTWLQN